MDDEVWTALGDRNRRAVLDILRTGPRSAGDLVAALGISQPSASKHLGVLRSCGLVTARVDAQRRIYRINPSALADLDAWLAPYRALWNTRLDALGRHLDQQEES
ncbi:MAG: transcriptional regulator [Jatrophihabitantaceae bacterium]|nr:transcriptional regulator [Jatrophihabitantaceae bacterium]